MTKKLVPTELKFRTPPEFTLNVELPAMDREMLAAGLKVSVPLRLTVAPPEMAKLAAAVCVPSRLSVPPETVVAPPYVFAPLSVHVPAPLLTRARGEVPLEITPLTVPP